MLLAATGDAFDFRSKEEENYQMIGIAFTHNPNGSLIAVRVDNANILISVAITIFLVTCSHQNQRNVVMVVNLATLTIDVT